MKFLQPQLFAEAVAKLGNRSPIGAALSSAQWRRVPVALRERAFFSARVEDARFLSESKRFLGDFLQNTVEELPNGERALKASGRAQFIEQLQQHAIRSGLGPLDPKDKGGLKDVTSEKRLALIFDTNVKSAQDFGYWKQGQDPDLLAAFPGQRFIRVRDVHLPRPWHEAAVGKVRLKTDLEFWVRLNRDFGVPWGPWGFGSGCDVEDVDRDEAEADGLLKPNDVVQPVDRDFNEALKLSTRGLDPALLGRLQATFGDQAVVEGDSIRWRGQDAISDAEGRPMPLAPVVKKPAAGPGLKADPTRATRQEVAIVNEPLEHGVVYDEQGSEIPALRKEGERTKVGWEPDEHAQLVGRTVAHNHPSGAAFSLDDLYFAVNMNVAELRVIAPGYDRRAHLFRLRRPASGWDAGLLSQLSRVYRAEQAAVQRETAAAVAHGDVRKRVGAADSFAEVMRRLQSRFPEVMLFEEHVL